jgi:Arc/MetJ-type ribon-helix-helix transcriptional regulator
VFTRTADVFRAAGATPVALFSAHTPELDGPGPPGSATSSPNLSIWTPRSVRAERCSAPDPVEQPLALDSPRGSPVTSLMDGNRMAQPGETETITVNLGPVYLGQIDLLVQEGFYSNRTDFIRTTIRAQLATHGEAVGHTVARKTLALGVHHYTRRDLEAVRADGQRLRISVLGLASIAEDVSRVGSGRSTGEKRSRAGADPPPPRAPPGAPAAPGWPAVAPKSPRTPVRHRTGPSRPSPAQRASVGPLCARPVRGRRRARGR